MKKVGGHVVTITSTSSNERVIEMRALHTHNLSPPDYHIDPHVLLDDYTEKEIRYAGQVGDVLVDVDVTNRTDVLRIIDRGKADQVIPLHSTHDLDAILSINVHNIKISRRVGEEVVVRIPIHEVAAICYVRDNTQHILAIKHGDPELTCQLAVVYVESKAAAEEICSLVGQCFQLVYTEATMQFFDRELQLAANGLSTYASSTTRSDSSTITKPGMFEPHSPSFITRSNPDLHSSQTPGTFRTRPRPNRTPSSASELSTPSIELLQDYMQKLRLVLSSDELAQFAMLLKAKRTSLPFSEFCDRVLSLFGPERKHLIGGLWPFIAEKDYAPFEAFLEKNNISDVDSGRSPMSSLHGYNLSRTMSESSAMDRNDSVLGSDDIDLIMENVISADARR